MDEPTLTETIREPLRDAALTARRALRGSMLRLDSIALRVSDPEGVAHGAVGHFDDDGAFVLSAVARPSPEGSVPRG